VRGMRAWVRARCPKSLEVMMEANPYPSPAEVSLETMVPDRLRPLSECEVRLLRAVPEGLQTRGGSNFDDKDPDNDPSKADATWGPRACGSGGDNSLAVCGSFREGTNRPPRDPAICGQDYWETRPSGCLCPLSSVFDTVPSHRRRRSPIRPNSLAGPAGQLGPRPKRRPP